VDSLAEAVPRTPHVILADYKGLNAGQATDLRRKIRSAGGTYMVLKNRLARRGSEGTAVAKIADALKGTCGLAAHPVDPVAFAKVVTSSPRTTRNSAPRVRRRRQGRLRGRGHQEAVDAAGTQELRAQLLALINTPATQLVRLLNTPAGQVARAIDARRKNWKAGR
jgi:large subunit ribosomal protein L10